MERNIVAAHPDNRAARAISSVLLIGLSSGALYLVVYLAQRALFRNGLLLFVAGITVRGDAASQSHLLGQYAMYFAATIALFALYVGLLTLCRRGHLRDRRARALALVFPVLFNLALLFGHPYLSIDFFNYVTYGYLGTLPGGNPYVQPASFVGHLPLGAQLAAFGWRPVHGVAPYGPLWTWCGIVILRLTGNITVAMFLFKGIVVAASLGSASLIWAILGRVRPADQLLGTLLYLWNPVVIVEFAAEGHNDALMILCVLAALLLTVRARPALALATLLLGVLAKYVPLVLFPAQAIYQWSARRGRRDRVRLVSLLLLGLLVGVGMGVLFYRPLWVGTATFQGVREQNATRVSASSTAGILYYVLTHSPFRAEAGLVTSVLLDGIFAVWALLTGWRARDADNLLRACAGIALVYILVASPAYWPWYATLPVALLALSPRGIFLWMAPALSIGARLAAPMEVITNRGFITLRASHAITAAIAVALPLLVCLLLAVREWRGQNRLAHVGRSSVAPLT